MAHSRIGPGEEDAQMLVGVYAVLGIFLIRAARDPRRNLSLIWFTVWSSVVHGTIMLVHSLMHSDEHGHLLGDVPALFIVAALLAVLTPRQPAEAGATDTRLGVARGSV